MRILCFCGRGRLSIGKSLVKLAFPARDAGLDSANGHIEDPGNFLVRVVFQVEECQRRAIEFVDLRERGEHGRGVQLVNHGGRDGGQFAADLVKFVMGEAYAFAA